MKTFEDFLFNISTGGYDRQSAEVLATQILFQEDADEFEFPKKIAEQIVVQFIATENSLDDVSFKQMIDQFIWLYSKNEDITKAIALFMINQNEFNQIKNSSKSINSKMKSLIGKVKKLSKGDPELSLEMLSLYALSL